MKNPDTTVLMPVHGLAPFLNEAIRSVLAQTRRELELLIVFDRPHQSAIDAVKEFQKVDHRIRSIHSTTPGISAALNLGISQSNTTLIARLDCDDVMEAERLEKQEFVMHDESIVCAGSQLGIMDSNGINIRYTHYPTGSTSIKASLRIRNVVAHPSVIFRKAAFELAGGYREQFNGSEDYDLWIRLSRIGRIVNIDQVLTKYRVHDNQASGKNKEIQIKLDADVRLINFNKLTDKPGLNSALFINKAIHSSQIQRIKYMVLAILNNPFTVGRFLIWQYIPEVFSNDR
jgi:O86/O127-antigen biosynthesis beta-1,3-galactosyltransferase